LQAVQLLTRAPDRFSAAQLTPLAEHGLSHAQIIDILAWSGACGWMNRLKIALGMFVNRRKMPNIACCNRHYRVKMSAALLATKIPNYVSGQPAASAA
jgi:hypothetical protein